MDGTQTKTIIKEPKKIELPNPIKAYKEHEEKKVLEKEQERIDTIMQNIDNYDGTENGQKELPTRRY